MNNAREKFVKPGCIIDVRFMYDFYNSNPYCKTASFSSGRKSKNFLDGIVNGILRALVSRCVCR